MLSLAQYLVAKGIRRSAFARLLGDYLKERIPPQSVHRWCLPKDDPDYSVPQRRRVEAIAHVTDNQVTPQSWYAEGRRLPRKGRPLAVSVAAARKAAATVRRRRELCQ